MTASDEHVSDQQVVDQRVVDQRGLDQRGHEARAIGQVRDRLQARFSDRSRTDVEGIVERTARRFANARIRDYIPLLVERISRDELNHRFAAR